jgi:hypothetical protein
MLGKMTFQPSRASVGVWAAIAVTLSALPAATAVPPPPAVHPAHDLADGHYPLDAIERVIAPTGKVVCPHVDKTRYRGDVIRYHSPVNVAVPFVPHLRAFETLVADVAVKHFGRAPRKIRHIGTYNCRRIRQWPTFLSEHGLANGIDIAAFEFAAAPRVIRGTLAPALRGAFSARIRPHWRSTSKKDRAVRAFLHDLGRRLVAAEAIFRVVLGPGYPGHEDHLHLDCAPWRLVEIDLDAASAQE